MLRRKVASRAIDVRCKTGLVQLTYVRRDQLDQSGSPADHGYLQAYRHTSPTLWSHYPKEPRASQLQKFATIKRPGDGPR
jgi:hypothetical protein